MEQMVEEVIRKVTAQVQATSHKRDVLQQDCQRLKHVIAQTTALLDLPESESALLAHQVRVSF